jgi:hypothetical protein
LTAFRQELSKLGWLEGKNITIEYRFSENKGVGLLPELAANLARLKVDLIVATDTPSALAAKNATSGTPIVMANVGDPVVAGLVASLARPGTNVTGNAGLLPPAKETQGCDSQARPSWIFAAIGRRRRNRPPTKRRFVHREWRIVDRDQRSNGELIGCDFQG